MQETACLLSTTEYDLESGFYLNKVLDARMCINAIGSWMELIREARIGLMPNIVSVGMGPCTVAGRRGISYLFLPGNTRGLPRNSTHTLHNTQNVFVWGKRGDESYLAHLGLDTLSC